MYRSLYGFWCFGFERFNSILGSYPNNKDVSITIIKKVYDETQINLATINPLFQPIFQELSERKGSGSLMESTTSSSAGCLLGPMTEYIISAEQFEHLSSMYHSY